MTFPPETFSEQRDVVWHDRGSSRMVLEERGKLIVASGLLAIGDAAAEEFFHERSISLSCPQGVAAVELAIVRWEDDDPIASRVAAVTLWWAKPGSDVLWNRTKQDVPVDSAVALVVDGELVDEALAPLKDDAWSEVMPVISDRGVFRSGKGLLIDCGTAPADFPIWEGRTQNDELGALRISTMLLDDNEWPST